VTAGISLIPEKTGGHFIEAARYRACASRIEAVPEKTGGHFIEAARYRACASRIEAARYRACASQSAATVAAIPFFPSSPSSDEVLRPE